jgi:hypothetical protein
MKEEIVDASWVKAMDKAVHLTVRGEGEEGEEARGAAETLVSEALRARGFHLVARGEAELTLTLVLRLQTLRDDRFLPKGTPVRAAVLDARVGSPEEEDPYVRRLGASKPEWGETGEEAVKRAVRDAWAVLSPHLLEALANH